MNGTMRCEPSFQQICRIDFSFCVTERQGGLTSEPHSCPGQSRNGIQPGWAVDGDRVFDHQEAQKQIG
jgi:hypothetical protein